jgi:hypothetical protein
LIPRILSSFVALVAVLPCRAEEPDAQAIHQKTLKASAWIVARGIRSKHEGTGFVVDRSRRWVVTNQHVVRESKAVDVFFPKKNAKGLVTERKAYGEGESVLGRVLATDALHDLAVIELDRMPEEVRELKVAERRPNLGERVYQVGNPGARNLWETNAGTVARFTSQAPKVKDSSPKPSNGRPRRWNWPTSGKPKNSAFACNCINPTNRIGSQRGTNRRANRRNHILRATRANALRPRLISWELIEVRRL